MISGLIVPIDEIEVVEGENEIKHHSKIL